MKRVGMTFQQSLRKQATLDGRVIRFYNRHIDMGPKVLELLLLQSPDRVITTSDIIEYVWPEPNREPDWAPTLVRRCIMGLRKRGIPIALRKGFGYAILAGSRSEWQARPAGRMLANHNPTKEDVCARSA